MVTITMIILRAIMKLLLYAPVLRIGTLLAIGHMKTNMWLNSEFAVALQSKCNACHAGTSHRTCTEGSALTVSV